MPKKRFSLEEANQTLEEIKSHVEDIVELNRQISYTSKDVETLFDIWGDNIMEKNNPDNTLYFQMVEKGALMADELKERVTNVEKTGCYLKDLKLGLVDFPFDDDGKTVLLCWKAGEDKIKYWHDTHIGFSGRKPIKELINRPISKEQ